MKFITIHLIVDVISNVDCFLCNLSEEKKSKREIDLLNFIAVVIFKRCWYLSILTEELAAIFWSSYNWRESRSYYQKVIIKKARRVKNEVGKRSKSKQLYTEPKEKAFLIYTSFTIKKMKVDFCFDTHSAG